MAKWIKRARYEMAPTASRPGVWKLKTGGWYVRGRTTDPKAGKQISLELAVDEAGQAETMLAALPCFGKEGAQVVLDHLVQDRMLGLPARIARRRVGATDASVALDVDRTAANHDPPRYQDACRTHAAAISRSCNLVRPVVGRGCPATGRLSGYRTPGQAVVDAIAARSVAGGVWRSCAAHSELVMHIKDRLVDWTESN